MRIAFVAPREPLKQLPLGGRTPGSGEVLVRLEACGLGQADWNVAMLDALPHAPLVPGCEAVGRVVAVGPDVTLEPGARVGITPLASSCGTCESCRSGWAVRCAAAKHHGFHVDGALASEGVFCAQHLMPLPEGVAGRLLAPVLASGWTALAAVELALSESRVAQPSVGVFGVGGVGHLALAYALHLGARVVAHDVERERQAFALSLGAQAWSSALTLDAAIVCTPSTQAVAQAVRAVKRGGAVVLAGATPTTRLDVAVVDLVARGVRLIGTFLGDDATLRRALDWAARGVVQPTVSVRPMAEAASELYSLRDGGFHGRLVFDCR